MSDKLTYEDLKLGEKAVDLYRSGASPEEILKNSPVYLNTKPVIYDLNTTDLAIAGVLAGLNQIYVGDSGTGKSQLSQDIYNYYFGGNKRDNGEAVKIRGYKLTERTLDELVFEELDIEKARWKLTENAEACFYLVDELNRAPTIRQNDCFELGDGILNRNGKDIPAGRDGYTLMIATANLGNGDFQGTFEIDKAMYNRLGIAIDFDYSEFQPTFSNQEFLDKLRAANMNIKTSPKRNIVDKIIAANKEISDMSMKWGLESRGILQFLKYSMNNCSKGNGSGAIEKNQKWYIQNQLCQGCSINTGEGGEFALCSSIKSPVRRTLEATRQYASALYFLASLKGAKEIDDKEIIFKAFELTGAYQNLLNPFQLKGKYFGENPKMMKDVINKLKDDFRKKEDFIFTTLSAAENNNIKPSSLYIIREKNKKDRISGDLEKLSEQGIAKLKSQGIEVSTKEFDFNDKEKLGYSWVSKSANHSIENNIDMKKEDKKDEQIKDKNEK